MVGWKIAVKIDLSASQYVLDDHDVTLLNIAGTQLIKIIPKIPNI
ncbi:Predicted protein [Listeria monocytogenes QOC1]|nr:Predicted protein [Listeria monocytogenes QOC1]